MLYNTYQRNTSDHPIYSLMYSKNTLLTEYLILHVTRIFSCTLFDRALCANPLSYMGASGGIVIWIYRDVARHENKIMCSDRYYTPLLLAMYLFKQSIQCIGTAQRNTISNWRFTTGHNLKKQPHGFSQEYATNFHSVNVAAVTFKDNSNITLTSMFVNCPNHKRGDMIGRKTIK
jgi:hypothetical protein